MKSKVILACSSDTALSKFQLYCGQFVIQLNEIFHFMALFKIFKKKKKKEKKRRKKKKSIGYGMYTVRVLQIKIHFGQRISRISICSLRHGPDPSIVDNGEPQFTVFPRNLYLHRDPGLSSRVQKTHNHLQHSVPVCQLTLYFWLSSKCSGCSASLLQLLFHSLKLRVLFEVCFQMQIFFSLLSYSFPVSSKPRNTYGKRKLRLRARTNLGALLENCLRAPKFYEDFRLDIRLPSTKY